jgi:hypothetical protein
LCPDLTILDDYSKAAPDSYWEAFPKNSLPDKPSCDVNIQNLSSLCEEKDHLLTNSQISRANTCKENLMKGASSFQKDPLPACFQKNANNTVTYGKEVADAIASWVSKGFVAGPFDNPPVKDFRSNPLMAIQQSGKVRPVLNLSAPEGLSFNDYVDEIQLEKVFLSFIFLFQFSILCTIQYT